MRMTEEEFYNKILDAEIEGFQGEIHELLEMTKEEYRNEIHCKHCGKTKEEKKNCKPYNPYCCLITMEAN